MSTRSINTSSSPTSSNNISTTATGSVTASSPPASSKVDYGPVDGQCWVTPSLLTFGPDTNEING